MESRRFQNAPATFSTVTLQIALTSVSAFARNSAATSEEFARAHKLHHVAAIKPGLRRLPKNGNFPRRSRKLSASSPVRPRNLELGRLSTGLQQPRSLVGLSVIIPASFSDPGTAGWGGRIRTSIWRIRNRMLLPVQKELQNPVSLRFVSLSKHSNFENRTESAESRASERNGPFGEE
jgi:hypothetical protein